MKTDSKLNEKYDLVIIGYPPIEIGLVAILWAKYKDIKTIVDVHLTGSENYFQKRYSKVGKNALPYLWKAETFPELPRSFIEPFGITLIFEAIVFIGKI